MKKIILFPSICIFLILLLGIISSVEKLDEVKESVDEKMEKVEGVKESIEEKKWDYLSEQWNKILLKNKFVSGIDGFFKKINIVFVVLFGENYALSLTLFFVVVLWIFFFINFNIIFRDYSIFSSGISLTLAFFLAIILAQFGFYKILSEIIFKLIFFKEGIWGWFWFFAVLIIIGFLISLNKTIGKQMKGKKEQYEKERAKVERGILHRFVTAITNVLKND